MTYTEWFYSLFGLKWEEYKSHYITSYGIHAFNKMCDEFKEDYITFCKKRKNEYLLDW